VYHVRLHVKCSGRRAESPRCQWQYQTTDSRDDRARDRGERNCSLPTRRQSPAVTHASRAWCRTNRPQRQSVFDQMLTWVTGENDVLTVAGGDSQAHW